MVVRPGDIPVIIPDGDTKAAPLRASELRPVAVLDMGATAIRMLVAELPPGESPRILEEASRAVLLGKDAFTSGRLGSATIEATLRALEGFRRIMDGYGVVRYRAVATSAVREAINRDTFLDRVRLRAGIDDIAVVRSVYEALVRDLGDLDLQLKRIELQEATKRDELRDRKAELAGRIRDAYEAERTSLLETFLSGATFTDMLAEMSTQLDVAEQDRALAQQIAKDRETLLALHRTVEDTHEATVFIRQETAVQRQKLDRRLDELRKATVKLRQLEKAAEAALKRERAQYARLAADKEKLREAMANTAARRKLQKKIDRLIAQQYQHGNIPSEYNGTLIWPMAASSPRNSAAPASNGSPRTATARTSTRASTSPMAPGVADPGVRCPASSRSSATCRMAPSSS